MSCIILPLFSFSNTLLTFPDSYFKASPWSCGGTVRGHRRRSLPSGESRKLNGWFLTSLQRMWITFCTISFLCFNRCWKFYFCFIPCIATMCTITWDKCCCSLCSHSMNGGVCMFIFPPNNETGTLPSCVKMMCD